jgi:MSHA pilin protein MshD
MCINRGAIEAKARSASPFPFRLLFPLHVPPSRAKGFSLVEVILFMVVVSVALVAVIQAFNLANVGSADPVLRRQSLAIAQSLLEEINFKPFRSAATDDPLQGGFAGPYTAANRAQFDDLEDYNGFSMTGISTLTNETVAGLQNHSASVAVTAAAFGGVPSGSGYRITVTVTDPASNTLAIDSYRAEY